MPGPGGPPGDFGPGTFLAPRRVEAIDANRDERVAPDEAARGAETFVRTVAPTPTGSLDEANLAAAINARIGPPPGFGGPGGPRGAEQKIV